LENYVDFDRSVFTNEFAWAIGHFKQVASSQSADLYQRLMIWGMKNGMSNFEIDFLDFNFLLMDEFQQTVNGAEDWLRGMAEAGTEFSVPIQYSMPLPSDLLLTLQFDIVTNVRASDDYPTTTNWNIGSASLLHWAMDVRPSKDTFWTQVHQPENPYNGRIEPSPSYEVLASLMSCGPVGFGDKLNYTNVDLILSTCNADGLLLQPSKPLTSIDAKFSINDRQVSDGGQIWASYSQTRESTYYQYYLMSMNVSESFIIDENDFYPPMDSQNFQWVYRRYSWDLIGCTNGSQAVPNCVRQLEPNSLPDVATGLNYPNGSRNFDMWTFSPIVNGYALLGELDKIVGMSPKRFDSLEFPEKDAGMAFGVSGAVGEVVHVWTLQPSDNGSIVIQLDVEIPGNGRTFVVLS